MEGGESRKAPAHEWTLMGNPALHRLYRALTNTDDGRVIVTAQDLRFFLVRYGRLYRQTCELRLENEALGRIFGPTLYGEAAKIRLSQVKAKAAYETVLALAKEVRNKEARAHLARRKARVPSSPSTGLTATSMTTGEEVGGEESLDDGGDE